MNAQHDKSAESTLLNEADLDAIAGGVRFRVSNKGNEKQIQPIDTYR